MRFRRFSIRFKLFFAFAVVGLISAGLISIQTYTSAQKIINDTQATSLITIRNIKTDQIRSAINMIVSQFELLDQNSNKTQAAHAFIEAFQDVSYDDPETLRSCAEKLTAYYNTNLLASEDSASLAALISGQYMPGTNTGILLQCKYLHLKESSQQSLTNFLPTKNYDKAYDRYSAVFDDLRHQYQLNDILILDAYGNVVYSAALNIDFAINVNHGAWANTTLNKIFTEAKESNGVSYAKMYDFTFYPPEDNAPTAFVASPIISDGRFIGAFIAAIGTAFLDQMVSSNQEWESDNLGRTGETYIVGGDLYMRTNSKYINEDFAYYLAQLKVHGYDPKLINMIEQTRSSVLLQQVHPKAPSALFTGRSGITRTTDYLGNAVLVAYAPLNLPGLDWGIEVKINENEIKKPLHTLKIDILQTMVLVGCLVVILTLFVSKAITRPIVDLGTAVANLTNGDYSRRINDVSTDEIGELSRTFDHMADTINERSQEILRANNSLIDEVRERRQTEVELQQERDFINAILDSQIILLMVTNPHNEIVRVNRTMEINTGYNRSKLREMSPQDLFNADTADVLAAAGRVRTEKQAEHILTEVVTNSGAKHIINWLVNTMINPSDHLIWTGIDITEQKSVEEQLKDNINMIESITSNAQDAIFISDENDRIISWNISAEKMFGYTNDEIRLKNVVPTLFPESHSENLVQKDGLSSSIQKKGITIELTGIRKGDEMFPVEVSISLVSVQGKWNTLFIVRDIASRKEKEETIRKALESARIAEKTKAEFLANMSHEIRTPLNGILGFLELLQNTNMDQTQNEYLKIINSSADSLLGVINEILDYSKIESGKMQLEAVPFNLTQELENVMELYTAKANEKLLELILDTDTKVPPNLLGDPLRLKQIVSNLLSNAIKFTHKSGTITLSTRLLLEQNSAYTIRIAVTDTGIGISKQQQNGIFEAFSQADTSVTRKYGGTGLGLTISARLARLMNSALQLKSQEGIGSTFWLDVTFNLAVNDAPDEALNDYFKDLHIAIVADIYQPTQQYNILNRYLNFLGCDTISYSSIDMLVDTDTLDALFIAHSYMKEGDLQRLYSILPDHVKIGVIIENNLLPLDGIMPENTYTLIRPINMSKIVFFLNQVAGKHADKTQPHVALPIFQGKALVAEDNPVNQHLINILLTNLGVDVDITDDGQAAYDAAIQTKYDIIFMDIHMPVMDGITVTGRLLEYEKTNKRPHTPIVAITANVIEENRIEYLNAGMDDFIAKPVVLTELIQLLRKYLPEKAPAEAADSELSEDYENESAAGAFANFVSIADKSTIIGVLTEYFDHTEKYIEIIRGNIMKNNFEDALKHSMSIRGASLNLRFDKVNTILKRLDMQCTQKNTSGAIATLDELSEQITHMRQIYLS